jgi:cell division transport system ATP-binding protein
MIEFNHVTKRYPESGEALSDVSFHIERGVLAFLTGHSGAGKSTLLRLIPAIERPAVARSSSTAFPCRSCGAVRYPICGASWV